MNKKTNVTLFNGYTFTLINAIHPETIATKGVTIIKDNKQLFISPFNVKK